jgi:hypothetical protein
LALALAQVAGPARPQDADAIVVTARREAATVAIDASATIDAPLSLIWETITDYDHLAQFIPGIKTSRVVARRGPVVTIEQTGVVNLLLFEYHIRIVPVGTRSDRYLLNWNGVIEPAAGLPVFLALPLVRSKIDQQFTAMVREIERRAANQGSAAAGGTLPLGKP